MSKLIFDRGNFTDFTSVSNVFIDEYMAGANGEFIKIYLYLLRLVSSGDEDISITRMADKFQMLEADVVRALQYWSQQNLITLSFDEENKISGIRLESLNRNRYFVKGVKQLAKTKDKPVNAQNGLEILATASGESRQVAVPESSGMILPSKKKYSSRELASFAEDERLCQLTFLAQTYLGKTLNSSEINSLLYLLDGLQLDTDFIEYIMETCISSGHKSLSYIEKQAVSFAQKGIRSVNEAKSLDKLKNKIYQNIYKIFGLTPGTPVKRELLYLSKWTDELGFSDDIILEACHRTMEHTHTASFQYTDKILLNWSGNHVKSMEDIEKLDKIHTEQITGAYQTKTAKKPSRPKKAKTFEEREYDYQQLEKQLMESQDKKIKQLLSNQSAAE